MTLPISLSDSRQLAMVGASAAEIAKAVTRMLASFPAANVSPEDAKTRLENYAAAFGATPIEAIRQAARNLLAGSVDGYDGRFAPTPPQWAKEARRVHHAMLASREPEKAKDAPSVSAEERAKVGELMARLERQMSAGPEKKATLLSPDDELELLADQARQPIRVSAALMSKIGGAA